ncbi:neuron-specific calcium-binding protein hippocalcin-like isoform X2 [Artemia franciscana]|uniref:neuron-specific calcium-binding protein hippocalcin-like isoform X2 n=1 Tax=Artemia franciscana TaxID=6661 RepID=UPI0032D9BBAA
MIVLVAWFKKEESGENSIRHSERSDLQVHLLYMADLILEIFTNHECPSGVISEGIFRLLLASLFPNGDSALYAHLVFRAFDAREVGYLVFEDFASMMSTICRGSQGDKLQFVFRMYDIDGNGAIDKDELFQIITAVHKLVLPKKNSSSSNLLHHHLVERHVERIWKRLDVEDNGFITQDDFVRGCLSEPAIVESLASLQDPENYEDSPGPSSSPESITGIE